MEESTGSFPAANPRIILLLLFFHPQLTSMPVCGAGVADGGEGA